MMILTGVWNFVNLLSTWK